MIQQAIVKLVEKENLTRDEAYQAMNEIMSGVATASQIAGFLMGLRLKGETVLEIAGCAQAMREKAVKVKTKHKIVIDTCGTGGDAVGTFNISTAAAIVACGAGAVVAKHGNRAISSKCGSADVLKALGVKIEGVPVEKVEQCLDEVGMAFLFAPLMHGAMKYAAPVRKELGVRTIFNLLGPLTNPAETKRQLIGVYDEHLTEPIACVLKELGSEYALVVHGADGFDEISTFGFTTVSELKVGEVRTYRLNSQEFGFRNGEIKEILGGDAATNARIIQEILDGKKNARRDIVVFNAGAALLVAGLGSTLHEGIALASNSIDDGKAKRKLKDLIEMSNS